MEEEQVRIAHIVVVILPHRIGLEVISNSVPVLSCSGHMRRRRSYR